MTKDEIFLAPYTKPLREVKHAPGETVGLKFVRVQASARMPIIEDGKLVREVPLVTLGILPLHIGKDGDFDAETKKMLLHFFVPYLRINFADVGPDPAPKWWEKFMDYVDESSNKKWMNITEWMRSIDDEANVPDDLGPIDKGFLRVSLGTEVYAPI